MVSKYRWGLATVLPWLDDDYDDYDDDDDDDDDDDERVY